MARFRSDDDLRKEGAVACAKTKECVRPEGHSGRCLGAKRDKAPAGVAGVTPIRKPGARSLESRIDGFIGGIGALAYPFDPICGGAVLEQSGELAAALDALARENPRVKQTLERVLTGGAWSGVVLAAAPIALAIAGHHVLPLFGKQMPSAPVPLPIQPQKMDEHRPVSPGQQASHEAGWNDAFAQVAPEEVFGGAGGV